MNTIKDIALNWWNKLSNREKAKLTFYFDAVRKWEELFEAEIEDIFYQEVVEKWWDKQPNQGELHNHSWSPSVKEIKEIYLEEHTKEQPQLEVINKRIDRFHKMYLAHDENYTTSNDVQDLKESYYYKGRRDEAIQFKSLQPKAIEDNVWDEAQKEYHKLYSVKSVSGLDILTIPQRHLFKWLEQHYSLIKK